MTCPRRPGEAGDPSYLRLQEALAEGAVPFTCQGPDNGLAIEGGSTLAWEIADELRAAGRDRWTGSSSRSAAGRSRRGSRWASTTRQRSAPSRPSRPSTPSRPAAAAPLARALRAGRSRTWASSPAHPPIPPSSTRASAAWRTGGRATCGRGRPSPSASPTGSSTTRPTTGWRSCGRCSSRADAWSSSTSPTCVAANALACEATGIDADETGTAGVAGLLALAAAGILKPARIHRGRPQRRPPCPSSSHAQRGDPMTTLRPPDPALLDGAALEALHGRSMLLTQDWTTAEIETLCSLAETLQALDRQGRVPALFPQQLFWALFFDQSTRTKSSWAGAAARLGGQAGDRRRLLHPGQPRRDLGGDGRDAGHERARAGHPPRPHPGRGQPLHAGCQAGHRRLPGGDGRRARRAHRQPPVRHRPPDPVAGRPAVAAGAVPGRPGRPDDHDELGLLAQLRQAALRRAGHRHADDPVRGARPARPPRGLPADGPARSRRRRPTPRRRAARSP